MNNKREYTQCNRCVLDTSTSLISFDKSGICNYCNEYDKTAKETVLRPLEVRKKELDNIVSTLKKAGQGKEYDCIIGVSGGMDSSYLAVVVKELGLRPLVVHFDNGWNSELAVKNIENLLNKLNYSLSTHVINWEEFKDLQIAYFKASVIDIEVPTDQLIFAVLFKIAKENKINYILEGYNFRTEFGVPLDWTFERKFDLTNLKNIHKKFGKVKLKEFPTISDSDLFLYDNIYHIKSISIINLLDFDWKGVKKMLTEKYDYTVYQYKHYESIFTRFYQGYILPKKFAVDKRKAHLSTLVRSGFITKQEAIEELKGPPYPLEQQANDKEYVLKKWEMSEKEFDDIMKQAPVSHGIYGYDKVSFWPKFKVRLYLIYLYKFAYPFGLKKRPVNT